MDGLISAVRVLRRAPERLRERRLTRHAKQYASPRVVDSISGSGSCARRAAFGAASR